MDDIRQDTPEKPAKSRIIDLLIAYRLPISLISIGFLIYVLVVRDIQLPQWLYVFLLGLTLGSIPAYAIGNKIVDWLYNPPTIHIIELDMTQSDYNFGVWSVPVGVFKQIESVGGDDVDLEPVRTKYGTSYIVEWFDADNLEAKGVWTGSATNREMMLSRTIISEIREELEEDARDVYKLRTKLKSIVRKSVKLIVFDFLETTEREEIYKGENISQVLSEVMEEAEIDGGKSEFEKMREEIEQGVQEDVEQLGESKPEQ